MAISVERARELLASDEGRQALEPAIARACGRDASSSWLVPCYLTTPPGEPGYGDRCLEMIEAARTLGEARVSVSLERPPDGRAAVRLFCDTPAVVAQSGGESLADALALALAAAGLLEESDDGQAV